MELFGDGGGGGRFMSDLIAEWRPMFNHNHMAIIPQVSSLRPRDARIRPDTRQHEDPLGYNHPYQ